MDSHSSQKYLILHPPMMKPGSGHLTSFPSSAWITVKSPLLSPQWFNHCFCHNIASARAEASNSGLIEPVVALLRDSSNTNVVKNAAFALGNICLDSNANKSKVKLLGGVQVLFNVIRTVPKKEKEVKLRLAATTTMLSLCDENVELPEDVRKVVDKVKKSKRPGRQIQEAVNKISYSRSSLCGPSFAFMYPERSGSQTSQTMQGDLCGD